MHAAAQGGHIEIIKYLLPMFGARVHEKTNASCTVLHWAALGGHCQVARYLITELKLDPKDRDKVRGCEGTALVSECKVYMHANMYACFRLCSEAYVVTKQVSLGHVYVMFMYSPVLCLQGPIPLFAYWFLFGITNVQCSQASASQ